MTDPISAILFDVGGTLRRNTPRDPAARDAITRQILDLLGASDPAKDFADKLAARADAYEEWAATMLDELDETRLWTEWMLPEFPPETISPIVLRLNQIWRDAIATRTLFPETVPVIRTLHQKGYRLGLISNTTSRTDALAMLAAAGIASLFEVALFSCAFGRRKPDPAILVEGADRLGIPPGQCAYIGDRPDWDVRAARRAGFGMAILLRHPAVQDNVLSSPDLVPDYFIHTLQELPPLFPQRTG